MPATASSKANQLRDEPVLLHPGQRIEYREEVWEVWAIEADGTVGLIRLTLGVRPHFLRIPATHLLRPGGSTRW